MDKVAIYCRLSEEDRNKAHEGDDSESIKNQKAMLTQYAIEHSWQVYDIYSDDDFTGSDRNRPDFNRLLRDAKDKKFDIVLCKTQSRFTRELELVERYIHYLFPLWGIRFVSVVDNADTSIRGNKKSRQINGLINEWYLEDMSDNRKAVLTARRKDGYFIGSFAPYGYKKDPNLKGHLIIDEKVAPIVKEIFDLYTGGMGRTAIARHLNENGVLSPGLYKISNGEKYKNTSKIENAKWHYWTIASILNNETYIGNLVQNKAHSISYKTKIIKPTSKDEWIRVEGTHEAIISKEVFDLAQKIAQQKSKCCMTPDRTIVNIFSGKIFCGKCKSSMKSYINQHLRYLRCTGNLYDRSYCQGTYISYERLKNEVLKQFQEISRQYVDINSINDGISFSDNLEIELQNIESAISLIEQKIAEIKLCIKNLYIDKVKGTISFETYSDLAENFSIDETKQLEELNRLKNQKDNIISNIQNRSNKLEIIGKYLECEDLTYEMVQIFIDKIYIYKDIGKSRDFKLDIYWNF